MLGSKVGSKLAQKLAQKSAQKFIVKSADMHVACASTTNHTCTKMWAGQQTDSSVHTEDNIGHVRTITRVQAYKHAT